MNEQLRWITEALEKHHIPYWVDTGTLLGLIREGKVLDHDGDIDVSLWIDGLANFEELVRNARREGYRIETFLYGRVPFKCKFIKRGDPAARKIDFKIYRRHGDVAWCPYTYYLDSKFLPLWLTRRYGRRILLRSSEKHDVARFPWSSLVGVETWWIPARHFEVLSSWRDTAVRIPADPEGYLRLHYGDWRQVRVGWQSDVDDGAVRHERPETLVPGILV